MFDPADSYTRAQRVERLLGNAVLLTVHSWGHPSYALPSKCVDRWRVRYVVDLITPRRAGRSARLSARFGETRHR